MCNVRADPRLGISNKVEDAVVQPPPRAVMEDAGFGVDSEPFVKIKFDVHPLVEQFCPRDLTTSSGLWGGRLGW